MASLLLCWGWLCRGREESWGDGVESGCTAKARLVELDVTCKTGRGKGVTRLQGAGGWERELLPPEREAAEEGFGTEQHLVLGARGGVGHRSGSCRRLGWG